MKSTHRLSDFTPAKREFHLWSRFHPPERVDFAEKSTCFRKCFFLVGEDGFEPSKRYAADLQSVPFGHSGTPPYSVVCYGAGRRTRTPDLLITNQLLYQLSYTGGSNRTRLLYHAKPKCQAFFYEIPKTFSALKPAKQKVEK